MRMTPAMHVQKASETTTAKKLSVLMERLRLLYNFIPSVLVKEAFTHPITSSYLCFCDKLFFFF